MEFWGSGRSGKVLRGAGRKRDQVAGWVAAVLLVSFAALSRAQAPAGSLSGKLTDLYSRPVDGARLVLRNAATGTETTGTTSKNGHYRFTSLAPGEYTLEAGSPRLGEGRIGSIFVSSGHEARVQAAIEFVHRPAAAEVQRLPVLKLPDGPLSGRTVTLPSSKLYFPPSLSEAIPVDSYPLETGVSPQPLSLLTLSPKPSAEESAPPDATTSDQAHANKSSENLHPTAEPNGTSAPVQIGSALPLPGVGTEAAIKANVSLSAGMAPGILVSPTAWTAASLAISGFLAALGAPQATLVAVGVLPPFSTAAPGVPTLLDQQLQALPLSGRHWENFVLDAPSASKEIDLEDKEPATTTRSNPSSVMVDSANIRLAFGGRAGGRMRSSSLMGPAANESAVLEIRGYDKTGEGSDAPRGERALVETRSGTDRLHGQGFLFDRRNLFGALNPFTQWVKETTPATLETSPGFTAFPYTAPDREDRWGFGAGSTIRRRKLFWFGAYDGSIRNDPGVATVRHPDNFFAQPSNDEMQVLSARLGLSNVNPVAEGLAAYSGLLESLAGLLGPAGRTANQWVGFGRLDWQAAERHRFTLEGTGARWNSPGGGLARSSEPYGSHSFGASRASEVWLLGRWEAFVTPNLLSVTQGSAGRHILSEVPDVPSPFEQTMNVNAWQQLPQMVVDSRFGFTIGNPSRFGNGSYPDEHLYELQQAMDWVRGSFLIKTGVDWRHNADATSMIRNHTGTYHYSTVENFASDALVFAKNGLTDALDRFDQHNCDERGKAWRDAGHQLHGLGYLPCYSYYSQTLGPTQWHLSTNPHFSQGLISKGPE